MMKNNIHALGIFDGNEKVGVKVKTRLFTCISLIHAILYIWKVRNEKVYRNTNPDGMDVLQ